MILKRDWLFVGIGVTLTIAGIVITISWSIQAGMVMLFLLGLLLLVLGVLQRKHQARLQERVLYLIGAEKNRMGSRSGLDAISVKKILGILHAQQITLEKLNARVESKHDIGLKEPKSH